MLGRKNTRQNQPWLSDLLSTSWKSLKESEKSNVRAFTVSIGDPVKWDSNPGTLGLISDVATSKIKNHYHTHNWWTQCQCNTISSSSVVMTKSNQIKKSNELWAIYDIEQQQQIIDDVLSSTNHHFYKTHDNHNIVYFIH